VWAVVGGQSSSEVRTADGIAAVCATRGRDFAIAGCFRAGCTSKIRTGTRRILGWASGVVVDASGERAGMGDEKMRKEEESERMLEVLVAAIAAIINTRRGPPAQPITGRPTAPEELPKLHPRAGPRPLPPPARSAERVSVDGSLGLILSTTWPLLCVLLLVSRAAIRAFCSTKPLSAPCLNLYAGTVRGILVQCLLQCSQVALGGPGHVLRRVDGLGEPIRWSESLECLQLRSRSATLTAQRAIFGLITSKLPAMRLPKCHLSRRDAGEGSAGIRSTSEFVLHDSAC
jgi:hypothetical protein